MMDKQCSYRDVKVAYSVHGGDGPVLVLVHGYLESGEIWKDFVPLLSGRCRVICVDLPGHGRSGTWGSEHSMEDLAASVKAVLDAEGIRSTFLIGHSMGGYVTMAFAELYSSYLDGYGLFHSTCFADTEEKRANRDREISLVMCGKKNQIIHVNIPKAFADRNVTLLGPKVSEARRIAFETADQGIVAILNGMKGRADRSRVLEDPGLPLLLIGGMKDNYIHAEIFEKLVNMAPHASVLRLEESGHMGFVEEPQKSAEAILSFIEKHRPDKKQAL
jgi:pimeloyl-ACP methyl ester carboxylesterase